MFKKVERDPPRIGSFWKRNDDCRDYKKKTENGISGALVCGVARNAARQIWGFMDDPMDTKTEVDSHAVKPALCGTEYMLPGGKYRGRKLKELGATELYQVWVGFKAKGYWQVAAIIRDEFDRRIAK